MASTKKKPKARKRKTKPVLRDPEHAQIADLKPHPRNYRKHPEDQLAHLAESIRQNGFYRNVVVAKDDTILAGHGVVEAAKLAGLSTVLVVRLNIAPTSTRALKVLAADNTVSHLADDDDRQLTELLKELGQQDELLGTGYDEQMLAALAMVTRSGAELTDGSDAAEWAGMPEFDESGLKAEVKLIVIFETEEKRAELIEQLGVTISAKIRQTWSTRWPAQKNDDVKSVRFEDEPATTS